MITLIILCIVGLILSYYAYHVERNLHLDREFIPLCDFSDDVSCTKAFSSKWGNIIGVPNSLIGLLYYSLIIFFIAFGLTGLVNFFIVFAFIASLILAFISYILMRNFCFVCTLIYVLNTCMLLLILI